MPIYEFKCGQCDRIFDELINDSARNAEVCCPHCNHAPVNRLMSSFGFSSGSGSSSSGSSSSCSGCNSKHCSTCK